ncbi:MAG: tetratricopeptide repeat protein, partial [Chloroflexota bacterium]|nr:tetratricopeptide repeat protein [Chloroflexota bacterium]
ANTYLQQVRETGDPSLYNKAEDLLNKAAEIKPGQSELYAAQGSLALARHDFSAALRLGKQAVVADPGNAGYYGIVGDAQVELGQYEEAIKTYQAMVDRRPDFGSYSRVSHARELYGDPQGALQAMQLAIEAGSMVPENMAWAHVQAGNLFFLLGQLDRAAGEYDVSLQLLEDYPLALAGKAQVAAAKNDLSRAAELYERAFNRMPSPEYAILLGDVYSKMGEKQKASEQYEIVKAIHKLQQANGVNTDMETALFFADHDIELQESLKKARLAYEARPSIHAADALAWTLYKTGQPQEAQKYSAQALKLGTQDPLKLYHAGMIAKALGQTEQAREYLQRAVSLNPRFSVLYADEAVAALEELGVKTTSGRGR